MPPRRLVRCWCVGLAAAAVLLCCLQSVSQAQQQDSNASQGGDARYVLTTPKNIQQQLALVATDRKEVIYTTFAAWGGGCAQHHAELHVLSAQRGPCQEHDADQPGRGQLSAVARDGDALLRRHGLDAQLGISPRATDIGGPADACGKRDQIESPSSIFHESAALSPVCMPA